ncbi:HD domain-containing protein [bacterium]|nr:HD domain-containing protein [bacterium]
MNINRQKARELLKGIGMDEETQRHSEGVAKRAEAVCRILEAAGHSFYTERVFLAALLHDIGLTEPHGLDHGAASAEILKERGLDDLASLVKVHALPQTDDLPIEAKVLIYADITTGPDGKAIDPMVKLDFIHRLSQEWKNEKERVLALEAYDVKRRIVSEIDELIKKAMSVT